MAFVTKQVAPTTLRIRNENFKIVAAAIIGILASFIPWPDIIQEVSGSPMWDRSVYISKIVSGNTLLSYFHYDNIISFFTFEFLWAWLMDVTSRSPYLNYEVVFQIISSLTLSGFAAALARRKNLIYIIFLINPLVIDLVYSQLRLSLALSILAWLVILRVRAWYIFLPMAAIATMIHTAAIIFIAAHILASWTGPDGRKKSWSANKTMSILVLFGFSVGVLVGPLREQILSAVGDRRVEYQDASSSILYLSYWIVLFISLVADHRRTLKHYESRYAVAILGIVFINVFTGFYSLRFLAAIFPFLIFSSFTVFGKYNFLISIPFVYYVAFQWYYYIVNLIS